jgi:hypothetical protein
MTSQFAHCVDRMGHNVIYETWKVSAGIRVRVLVRDSLEELELFTMPRFPALRYEQPASRWRPRDFASGYFVPEQNFRAWQINRRNLVRSKGLYDGIPLERISFHPLTGEMLLSGQRESYHAHDIHNHGSHPFDEYVRALVLPEQRMVATRPFCPVAQGEASRLDERTALRLSVAAQLALRTVLISAGQPKMKIWKFAINTVNAHLEQLTGRRGW